MRISHKLIIPAIFLLPSVALAATTYNLLAPIAGVSSVASLKDYLMLVFRATIGLAGVLAVIMLVICGIRLMGTGSVSGKSEAKECIWNAIFGIILILGSWLILNTINPLLLNNNVALVGLASAPTTTPTAITEPTPTASGCYFKYKDNSSGNVRYSRSDTCPVCDKVRVQYQADTTNYTILSTCFPVTPGSTPTITASTPPPTTTGVTCPQSGLNLCEGQPRQCTNPKCAQFAPMAANHAGGAVSANLLKALVIQESSCGLHVNGDGGKSCGPLQINPGTANHYLSACGLTQPVTCGWLSDQANWDKAICLSAEYLRAISMTSCGTDVRNIAAGYNGGTGVCSPSTSCGSDVSCDGTTVRKWECLYDDPAHTMCNQGYNTTRNYATRVLYCTQNPGY